MKRKIFIIAVFVFLLTACTAKNSSFVDGESGLLVRTSTPQATVTSFLELVARSRYEKAFLLLTGNSAKQSTARELEDAFRSAHIDTAKLLAVVPGPKTNNLAVVAHLRTNNYTDGSGRYAVLGMEILKRQGRQWLLSRHFGEFDNKEKETLLKLLIQFEEELKGRKDIVSRLNGEQADQVLKQLSVLLENHRTALFELTGK